MSFNIWGGGGNEGKPVDETVAVIRAAGADIVGIQETRLEGAGCTAESCPPKGDSVAAAIASAPSTPVSPSDVATASPPAFSDRRGGAVVG